MSIYTASLEVLVAQFRQGYVLFGGALPLLGRSQPHSDQAMGIARCERLLVLPLLPIAV